MEVRMNNDKPAPVPNGPTHEEWLMDRFTKVS